MDIILVQLILLLVLVLLNTRIRATLAESERSRLQATTGIRDAAAAMHDVANSVLARGALRAQLIQEKAVLESSNAILADLASLDCTGSDLARLQATGQREPERIAEIERAISLLTEQIETAVAGWGFDRRPAKPQRTQPAVDRLPHALPAKRFAEPRRVLTEYSLVDA